MGTQTLRNTSKEDRYTLFLIIASCVCVVIQLYGLPRNNTTFMSLANRGMLLLWYSLGFLRILKHFLSSVPKYMASAAWILVLSLCSLLVGYAEHPARLMTNVTALVNFFVMPVMFLYSAFYRIPPKAKTAILVTEFIISIIIIQLYHSSYRHYAIDDYGEYVSDVVTLGYPNPNQTAMFVFACLIGLMAGAFYFRSRLVRWVLYIDILYLAFILYQTECRTAFILFVALAFFTIFKLFQKSPKLWINLSLAIPLLYAAFGLFAFSFFENVEFLGAALFNGREAIYLRYLNNLDIISFLLGDFNRFYFDNLHNGYLSIAATSGIVSAICFINLLKKYLDSNYRYALSSKYTTIAFIGFLCILLGTSTEAAFFVGGSTFAFMFFMVFALFAQPQIRQQS